MPKTITNATVIGQRVLNATTKLIEVYAPEIAQNGGPGTIRECAGLQEYGAVASPSLLALPE